MKHFYNLISLAILLVFVGCTKELDQTLISNKNSQIDSVKLFLKSTIPDRISTLNLESIKELKYNHKNMGFQIFKKSSSRKFLMLRKEGSLFSGNWVDFSLLTKNKSNDYSGEILLENFKDGLKTKFIVENNKVTQIEKFDKTLSRIIKIIPPQKDNLRTKTNSVLEKSQSQAEVMLPEIIIVVHNVDYLSLYWLFDQYSPFNYNYMFDFPGTTGGGGGGQTGSSSDANQNNEIENVVAMPVYNGPKTPIKNLKDELKCFTVNSSSTYSLSVNVNQPRPNSRDKINLSQEFMVGHSYLTLEQINSDGTKVVRNLGLYPQSTVYPGNEEDISVFGEDSNTPFSVSIKMAITGTELNTVINSLIKQQSRKYELSDFNCVNSAAVALGSINVVLPLTVSGVDFLYAGVNPGDLGQDIRDMDLKSFSENNGNRKISKSESKKNDMKPSQKTGSCK